MFPDGELGNEQNSPRQQDAAEFAGWLIERLITEDANVQLKLSRSIMNERRCTVCNDTEQIEVTEYCILTLPIYDNVSSMDTLINKKISDVTKLDGTCRVCEEKGTMNEHAKKINSAPETLIVMVQRVENPKALDEINTIKLPLSEVCYSLQSFAVHIGESFTSGHYVGYFNYNSTYYKYDDQTYPQISEVTDNEFKRESRNGYLYFYNKQR